MDGISFVIVNYNTKRITEDCVNSINNNKSLEKFKYEIIIVDNNSNDGSREYFKEQAFINTTIIENDNNEGFGKANNLGVQSCKGKYIVLLNSDTLAGETDFKLLIDTMQRNNNIGVLSAKILNRDSSIQSLGFSFPSLINELKLNFLFWNFNFMKRIRLKGYKNKGLFKVDWISGSFMVIRKDDYCSVGGFDENIFMYAEDLELCYKLYLNHKYSYVLDETSIYHLHGESGNKSKITLSKLIKRRKNYNYVIQKHKMSNSFKLLIMKAIYFIHAVILVTIKKIKA
ncbi:glycosyltransferase family 2 protein [Bacillus toyonensis]|uniref:glycosyltransferase family 2 protein n=1 Tax=Bacillus toyonensis TaxID=155322 RepID=UPI0025409165|nr:glycosyltransferase family 2 protein [Bacillus toyonensis]WIG36678.1 glycosyltransferase family 2 protein [Bacillus toyonensis]